LLVYWRRKTQFNERDIQLAADSGVMFACDPRSGSLKARIVVAPVARASASSVVIPAAFHCIA
jgi:hypothetical protein